MRNLRRYMLPLLVGLTFLTVPANAPAADVHHVVVTLYNADDAERLLLNGNQVASVDYNQSTTIDLGNLPTSTQLLFEVRNGSGGYTWGLRVIVDGAVAFDDKAGTVGVVGANGDDMGHQHMVVRRLQFTPSGEVLERFNTGRNEPSSWCGSTTSSDNLAHEVANGGAKWHVIYAYPNDAANRFGSLSGYLSSSTLAAQGLLTTTRDKPLRFDMGTDCGARYLDMTAVRLGLTSAQLDAASDKYWPVVGNLVGQGFNALDKSYLVFLDSGGGSACGLAAPAGSGTQRTPDNGHNNDGAFAILYRYTTPSAPESGGLCGGAALHEMLHSMGAVQEVAPNSNGGHCDDASDDVMCGGPFRGGGPFVDYGSDDYWDPSGGRLGWWAVNLNRFFCARTTCNNGEPTRTPLTGEEIGPIDFIGYCQSRDAKATLVGEEASQPQAAYHWRCEQGGLATSIDVHEVCRSQYGTWEGRAEVLDLDDAFSWQCLSDLNPPPPDPEPEGGGGPGGGGAPPQAGNRAAPVSGTRQQSGGTRGSSFTRCVAARQHVQAEVRAVQQARRLYQRAKLEAGLRSAEARRAGRNLRAALRRLAADRHRAARACAVTGIRSGPSGR